MDSSISAILNIYVKIDHLIVNDEFIWSFILKYFKVSSNW